jgi:hypothetical protein
MLEVFDPRAGEATLKRRRLEGLIIEGAILERGRLKDFTIERYNFRMRALVGLSDGAR